MSSIVILYGWHEGRFSGAPVGVLRTGRQSDFARGQHVTEDVTVLYDVKNGRVIDARSEDAAKS